MSETSKTTNDFQRAGFLPDENLAGGRLALLCALRRAARQITLPVFEAAHMQVENKAGDNKSGGFDPVTNADTEAERVLRELITAAFPDDAIEGEEFDDIAGTSEWSWTLDPIDGTRGFVAGVPVWSTLIAVSFQGAPVIGLMDFPVLGQSYFGVVQIAPPVSWRELDADGQNKAGGESKAGENKAAQNKAGQSQIFAKTCPTISDAILGCTEPLSMLSAGELAAYNVIRRGAKFSRLGLDAYGYAMVASGRMDIIIEAGLKPCDVRALMPVIEGAGGRLTNWHGGSAAGGGRAVAVGDGGLLPELYSYLGRAMPN